MSKDKKELALEAALKQIEKQYGKGFNYASRGRSRTSY